MSEPTLILICWSVLIMVWAWFMVCFFRTSRQRRRLIEAAYSDFRRDLEWSAEVQTDATGSGLNAHLWRVLTLRDPYELYSPELARRAKAGAQPWMDDPAQKKEYAAWLMAQWKAQSEPPEERTLQ